MSFTTAMPIALSLGFTNTQAINQFRRNRETLEENRNTQITKPLYRQVFNLIIDNGGLENTNGYLEIAKITGLTIFQVEAIVSEIFAYFQECLDDGTLDG